MLPYGTYVVILLLLLQVSNAESPLTDTEQLIAKLKKQNEELIKENAKLKQLYTSCSQRVNSSQRKKEVAEKQLAAYELQIAEQKEEIQKCSVEKFNFQAEITSLKEQLAVAADQIENQGASTGDPFLEGAKIEHEQFGNRIISESERQVCFHHQLIFQRNLLLEEAEEVGNGPKDIALFCASVCFTIVFCLCSPHKSVFQTWIAIW